ncbi:accessory gene regulator B family protein [Waltera sp.]|uniref:accessory gene regulator B family protein n=1 Tax=Waltera sp. TaxID=2815806 RepID=UPI0039A2A523
MERCTGKITDWLIKCGAIQEADRELYEYAIYIVFCYLCHTHAISISNRCIIWVRSTRGIDYYTICDSAEVQVGGYHAKSARVCFISSSLLLVLCIFLSSVIKCDIKLLVATILSAISLAYFSPLENENRLLSREEQKDTKGSHKVVNMLWIG